MGNSLTMKILSVAAVGIVLVQLSPIATGALFCIGDGADQNCCVEPYVSPTRVGDATQLRDASDCDCCIAIDAAPPTAGATSQKASLDILAGSGLSRETVSPAGTRIARPRCHDIGTSRLSSLRTVVLLI